jgi:hypothetical protein
MRTGTFAITNLEEIRTGDIIFGRHLPAIGTTPTALANRRCVGKFSGAGATAVEIAAVAAGTAFTGTTHDIAQYYWRSYLLSAQTGGTKTITVSSSSYATEALAIAALASTPSNEAILGYITIYADSAFTGATTSLADVTVNYYEGYGVMSGGITPYGAGDIDAMTAAGLTAYKQGFTIGTSAQLNIAGSVITWKAYRD